MTTDAAAALVAGPCPDPEQLAAYLDGTSGRADRLQVERHLLDCPDCREIIAGTVAYQAEHGVPAIPKRRYPARIAAVGAIAAAALLFLVLRLPSRAPVYYLSEMAPLVRVEAATRPIEPRLAGPFRYAAPPARTRGAADAGDLQFTATAQSVRDRIASRTGGAADAARGVTDLVRGDRDNAIAALERATAGPDATAAMFSDMAAAYLERGSRDDLPRALAAAQRAIALDPSLAAARFNRALALERLNRVAEARDAWRAYVSSETDAGWTAEARQHLARLAEGS